MDERSLTLAESHAFAIVADDPTASLDDEEDLPEAGLASSYLSTGREVDDVRVSLALAVGEPRSTRRPTSSGRRREQGAPGVARQQA
jgi:hypothetical protein